MKRKGPSDRVVRKALLQAHAQIERYEVARGMQQVQGAMSPRALVAQVLPGLVANDSGPGSAFTRAGGQLAGWYQRYPAMASTATWLLGRVGGGKAIQMVGLVLAVSKAIGMARRRG